MKKILIFGVTGQDGSLLAKYLCNKRYQIYGVTRNKNKKNLINLYKLQINKNIKLIELKNINYNSVYKIISQIKPVHIYNLSAQSSVSKSFVYPIQTYQSIYNLNFYILETLKNFNNKFEIKYFNACSGECFGNIKKGLANEKTPFNPLSPYAIAKTSSFYLVNNYRNQFNIFASNGILFNHESILRDNFYVTKKIIIGALDIFRKKTDKLELGNLNIYRDWGWAPEYVEAINKILNLNSPTDLIISSGKVNSLKKFIEISFKAVGLNWKNHVIVSDKFVRKLDVHRSGGSPIRAKNLIKWKTKLKLEDIVNQLIEYEIYKQSKKNYNPTKF